MQRGAKASTPQRLYSTKLELIKDNPVIVMPAFCTANAAPRLMPCAPLNVTAVAHDVAISATPRTINRPRTTDIHPIMTAKPIMAEIPACTWFDAVPRPAVYCKVPCGDGCVSNIVPIKGYNGVKWKQSTVL